MAPLHFCYLLGLFSCSHTDAQNTDLQRNQDNIKEAGFHHNSCGQSTVVLEAFEQREISLLHLKATREKHTVPLKELPSLEIQANDSTVLQRDVQPANGTLDKGFVWKIVHANRWKLLYWGLLLAMMGTLLCAGVFIFYNREAVETQEVQRSDAMTYHPSDFTSWTTLIQGTMTVWSRSSLWTAAAKWLALAAVVAFLVVGVIGDGAASMHTEKLTEVSRFLNAFVGLLLGFFLTASVSRWWSCADGFLMLFDAIRCLQMQLTALGGPQDKLDNCTRYGVISAWVLQMQLKIEAKPKDSDKKEAMEEMWKEFASSEEMDKTFAKLSGDEIELLRNIRDPAGLLWTWVASFVARLAQDGHVPPMQSPTYGRIMHHVVDAHTGIRKVRSSLSVQAPYIYVHLLASLVHVNNVVNAIGFGIGWGVAVAEAHRILTHNGAHERARASHDAGQMLLSFFYSCFGPLIYQAMLEVGIVIAEPFRGEAAQIPTLRLLKGLENDLHDSKLMTDSVPWAPPCFKA